MAARELFLRFDPDPDLCGSVQGPQTLHWDAQQEVSSGPPAKLHLHLQPLPIIRISA